jgi:DNA-binding SARP family transcriptional activator
MALKVDAYREDVHRLILQCYARLGEKTQILHHFNDLKKLLQEELGIEPARETRALVEQLLSRAGS